MKLINISIAIENYGIFYVDQYMKISFFPNKTGVGYWESHVSELNESEYVSTHEKFLDFLYHADLTSHYIDIHEFKKMMEKVFQAYCLLR